jgi:hypothetical protein
VEKEKLQGSSETTVSIRVEACNITEDQILQMLSDYLVYTSRLNEWNDLIFDQHIIKVAMTPTGISLSSSIDAHVSRG